MHFDPVPYGGHAKRAARQDGIELSPLLTTKEIAGLLQLSEKTVRRLAGCQRIPCVRIGRALRFVSGDVLAWLSARKEG